MKKLAIIDNGTDCLDDLIKLCDVCEYEYQVIPLASFEANKLSSFDCAVLTGGIWYPDATEQEQHYRIEENFLTHPVIPVVGICLGMQLMLSAFNGEISPLDEAAHGDKKVTLTSRGMDLLSQPHELIVTENHTMGALAVPEAFEVLGRSDKSIEIIRHKHLPLIGVQFHPEKSHRELAVPLWKSIIDINRR